MALIGFVERRAWVLALGALLLLLLAPGVEISLSALFFDPARHVFLLRSHVLGEFVRKILPYILLGGAAAIALAGAGALVLRRKIAGIGPREALYAVACLAIGPGLVVNAILKDYWGRPRPSTIHEFFGAWDYTPFIIPSAQCPDNCSFPSGHAALGFWTVSLALLAPPSLRRAALWAAVGFGAVVGGVRIAQGGHFLSDVIASGLIVTAVCKLLYQAILVRSSMTVQKNNDADSAESS